MFNCYHRVSTLSLLLAKLFFIKFASKKILTKLIIRKDVRLPVILQRAMAAEAEAAREARAKVSIGSFLRRDSQPNRFKEVGPSGADTVKYD